MSFKQFLTEYLNKSANYLRKYMQLSDEYKSKELAIKCDNHFSDYMENHNHTNISSNLTHTEYINNYPNEFKEYGEFLFNLYKTGSGEIQRYSYSKSLPTWYYIKNPKLITNEWLIHFTNSPMEIARQGFRSGNDDHEHLGLTVEYDYDEDRDQGFSFAFRIGNENMNDYIWDEWDKNSFKYGEQAVIFRSSGIEGYHKGDKEDQVIFWDDDAYNLIPIIEKDGMFFIINIKTKKEIYKSEDILDIIKWVKVNFNQYKKIISTRNR